MCPSLYFLDSCFLLNEILFSEHAQCQNIASSINTDLVLKDDFISFTNKIPRFINLILPCHSSNKKEDWLVTNSNESKLHNDQEKGLKIRQVTVSTINGRALNWLTVIRIYQVSVIFIRKGLTQFIVIKFVPGFQIYHVTYSVLNNIKIRSGPLNQPCYSDHNYEVSQTTICYSIKANASRKQEGRWP